MLVQILRELQMHTHNTINAQVSFLDPNPKSSPTFVSPFVLKEISLWLT